jgi:hypothetical protein
VTYILFPFGAKPSKFGTAKVKGVFYIAKKKAKILYEYFRPAAFLTAPPRIRRCPPPRRGPVGAGFHPGAVIIIT